jgi:hypothetical protein
MPKGWVLTSQIHKTRRFTPAAVAEISHPPSTPKARLCLFRRRMRERSESGT